MSLKFMALLLVFSFIPATAWAQVYRPALTPTRTWDLYADSNRVEMCPNCNHELPKLDIYGWKGQPFRGKVPGGCKCGRKSGLTWYNGYYHWPSPFSVLLDYGRCGQEWRSGTDTTCARARDILDIFAYVRLAPKVRTDNGYFGPYCDPYGFAGKSQQPKIVTANDLSDKGKVAAIPNRNTRYQHQANHRPTRQHSAYPLYLKTPPQGPNNTRLARQSRHTAIPAHAAGNRHVNSAFQSKPQQTPNRYPLSSSRR